jgi:PII-like signaling protein
VKESDTWHGSPLYTAFVQRLHAAKVAGATAYTGIMGFGAHHRIHHKGLFGIADDRPVTIFAVDEEDTLRTVLETAGEMLKGSLSLLVDVEMV